MDELIIQFLRGQATPEQANELRRWRLADPEHAERFREIEVVWRAMEFHEEIDPLTPIPRVPDVFLVRSRRRSRSTRWMSLAAAAAAALVVGIGLGRGRVTPEVPGSVARTEFRTGTAEMASVALDDGTVVRLGSNSRLKVNLAPGGRDVWLEGRAFFAVAPDVGRPFTVHTEAGQAVVLGTRFEVDTADQALRLMVLDGRVAVASGGNRIELLKGQEGHARHNAGVEIRRVPSPEERLDWMGAFVAFESTPLHQVAKELEVRFGIRLDIADSRVENRTVTGWFDEGDHQRIPAIVCRVAGVTCEVTEDAIRVSM